MPLTLLSYFDWQNWYAVTGLELRLVGEQQFEAVALARLGYEDDGDEPNAESRVVLARLDPPCRSLTPTGALSSLISLLWAQGILHAGLGSQGATLTVVRTAGQAEYLNWNEVTALTQMVRAQWQRRPSWQRETGAVLDVVGIEGVDG